jgi:aspartate/methionine/tyrosine aminotransferase
MISDTFLPVNETVQAAVPELMDRGTAFLARYTDAIIGRWGAASGHLGRCAAIDFVAPAGGFYVTVRLRHGDEEHSAETLLADEGLLVHPGYFYDIAPQHLVFSFVQEPETIRDAFPRLTRHLEQAGGRW